MRKGGKRKTTSVLFKTRKSVEETYDALTLISDDYHDDGLNAVSEAGSIVKFDSDIKIDMDAVDVLSMTPSYTSYLSDVQLSESESSSVGSYVEQKPLEEEEDFFEVLQEVPEIQKREAADHGSFFDPLTGEFLAEEEKEVVVEEEPTQVVEEEETSMSEPEDDDLLRFQEMDEKEVPTTIMQSIEDDEALEILTDMKFLEPPQEADNEEELKRIEQENLARSFQESIDEFIKKIINKAVSIAEYVDPLTKIKEKLDKRRLFNLFREKYTEYDLETAQRRFLNRKTVEYFRRKKLFYNITPDPPQDYDHKVTRYQQCLFKINETKARLKAVTENSERLISELTQTRMITLDEEKQTLHYFTELLRKTFVRNVHWTLMEEKLKKELFHMQEIRNQMNEIRLVFFEKQHQFAKLNNELEMIDNIGENVTMQDIETLNTEIISLDKKIEERNIEDYKMRARLYSDVHILAHLKNKAQMVADENRKLRLTLTEYYHKKFEKRSELNVLKIQSTNIRKNITEYGFKCGLINKPALLYDYDKTDDKVQILQTKIDKMKQKYLMIQNKLKRLEKIVANKVKL